MSKKVKSILFKLGIKGNGIVNYDSSEQKWAIAKTSLSHMKTSHNNTSYAKKRFYGTPEDTRYKIIISSDCLRHEIFSRDVPFVSPNVVHDEVLLNAFIASPSALLRGYMFTDKKAAYKRKSPLTITSAEQTNDSISYIETFSSSASKNSDTEKETADNTFYKKESIGEIEYDAKGFIDLMALRFLSCDQIFDRYSFNPDHYKIFKSFLSKKIPSFNSDLGYYQIEGSSVEIPEYGVKLSNEDLVQLVKELFERILSISIKRKDSYAKTSDLKYKLVFDPLEDTMESEDNWISIKSKDDLESIDFTSEDFYKIFEEEEALRQREIFKSEYEKNKAEAKKKKAENKPKKND